MTKVSRDDILCKNILSRTGGDIMRKKRLLILGLLICLLVMSAMAGQSNAWFTSSTKTDTSLKAAALTIDDLVDETLNGEFNHPGNGNTSTPIGLFRSKVDGLELSYTYIPPEGIGQFDPETNLTIRDINSIKRRDLITPTSPISLLAVGDSIDFYVNTQIKGNTPSGVYLGQLSFIFTVDGEEVLEWVLPLKVIVP